MTHPPIRPGARLRIAACTMLAALVGLVVVGPHAPRAGAQEGGIPVVHLDGRGHGHGVGMSQWGAYTMARDGAGVYDILGQFYPGTEVGAVAGEVVVVVDTRERVVVSLPEGGQLRSAREGTQSDGFPIALAPGEPVEILHDGTGYRVVRGGVRPAGATDAQRFRPAQQDCVVLCDPGPGPEPDPEPDPDPCVLCTTTTTSPAPPPTTPPPDTPAPGPPPTDPGHQPGPAPTDPNPPAADDAPRSSTPIWAVPNGGGTVRSLDRDRAYRGAMEVVGAPGAVRLRNHLDVEDYLRGMAEVPSTWPAAAVQAQSIAARTFALRAVAGRGELCDTESCQVYVGVQRETPGQDAAVAATRGQVLLYRGGLAATFYSSSAGGFSANVAEGFGATYDIPYLPARPYAESNPKAWQIEVALADVAARLGYPGTVTDVQVLQVGPSGRPLTMQLVGDAGTKDVDPQDFRRRLGLQSTLFTARADLSTQAPPPPPPPVDADQLTTAGQGTGDGSQLAAVGGSEQTLEAALASPRALVAPATTDRAGTSAGALTVLAALAIAAAVALTSHRLRLLGRATVADGLGTVVFGAPARGLPAGEPRRSAAMMGRWTRPSR